MIHILEKGEKADPLRGMEKEIITDEMIEALEQGKRLYLSVNDEYAVVIKKNGKRKTDKREQTQIIHCKDCEHFVGINMFCDKGFFVEFEHTRCKFAERKANETDRC